MHPTTVGPVKIRRMNTARHASLLLNSMWSARPAAFRRFTSSTAVAAPRPPYRVLLFGSDDFSCATLRSLYRAREGSFDFVHVNVDNLYLSLTSSVFNLSIGLVDEIVAVVPASAKAGRHLRQVNNSVPWFPLLPSPSLSLPLLPLGFNPA